MKVSMMNAQELPEQVTAILNKRGKWTGKELGRIFAIQFIANAIPFLRDLDIITQGEINEKAKRLTELQAKEFDGYRSIAGVCEYCLERQSAKLALIGNNLLEAMMSLREEIVACDFEVVTRTMSLEADLPKSLTTHLTDMTDKRLSQVYDCITFAADIFHQMKLTQLFLKLIFDKFDLPFYDTFDTFVNGTADEIKRYNGMREDVLTRLTADDTERREIMNTVFVELDLKSLEVTADEADRLTTGVKELKLKDVDTSILYRVAGSAAV